MSNARTFQKRAELEVLHLVKNLNTKKCIAVVKLFKFIEKMLTDSFQSRDEDLEGKTSIDLHFTTLLLDAICIKITGGQWSKDSFCPPGGRSYIVGLKRFRVTRVT